VTNPFALDTPAAAPAAPVTPPAAPVAPVAPPVAAPAAPAGDPFGGADPFSDPAPQEARGPRIRDVYGRLLLIIPHKLEEGIPNQIEKGKTQDRMTADVIILDGGPIAYGGKPEKVGGAPHDRTAQVPHKNSRMFISNAGLISQCRQALAKKLTTGTPGMVLGRLAVGEAKGDQNPPYLLTPATDADKAIARQYLANVDPFA
jgi:hypothetical protein